MAHVFSTRSVTGLFISTFVSSFLLLFGAGLLLLVIFPGAVNALQPAPTYHPQLPLAGNKVATPTPSPTTTPSATPTPSLAPVSLYPPLEQLTDSAAGNWIRIPSINVNVPLVMSSSINDSDVIKALNNGAAMYPNGVLPGHLGNVFIAAHSSGFIALQGKYRFAFTHLGDVQPGNIVNLDWNGTRYTYKVTGSETVVPSPTLRVTSDRPIPTVTLMACWPIWSTSHRYLLHAQLTNITELAQ